MTLACSLELKTNSTADSENCEYSRAAECLRKSRSDSWLEFFQGTPWCNAPKQRTFVNESYGQLVGDPYGDMGS